MVPSLHVFLARSCLVCYPFLAVAVKLPSCFTHRVTLSIQYPVYPRKIKFTVCFASAVISWKSEGEQTIVLSVSFNWKFVIIHHLHHDVMTPLLPGQH